MNMPSEENTKHCALISANFRFEDRSMPAPTSMKPLYLDLPTVAATVSLSEASVQKLVRENQFPKPWMLSGRRVAWLTHEVETWAE